MVNWGIVPVNSVLTFPFGAVAADDGASISISGLAVGDIRVYKGTSMTQRSSTNGFTLLDSDGIDIDGMTGIHGFAIDTSDNSDAGFYAAGSFYYVVVNSITVDTQTVSFVAGTFALKALDPTVADVADAIWDEARSGHVSAGSFGEYTPANVTLVSGDSAAADNLEAMLDGTGGVTLSATLSDLGTIIADSVPADGTRPTIKQALYMLVQFMVERNVSGTTVTVRKVDGSTSLFTLTLNDATSPTSITRAT
jgi:hypothetical protein